MEEDCYLQPMVFAHDEIITKLENEILKLKEGGRLHTKILESNQRLFQCLNEDISKVHLILSTLLDKLEEENNG